MDRRSQKGGLKGLEILLRLATRCGPSIPGLEKTAGLYKCFNFPIVSLNFEVSSPQPTAPEKSLPDYLQPGLRLVLIGINPGIYSAQVGHYFARPGNLFWWAVSNSGLVPETVGPTDELKLLGWRIGLTDVVQRPTHSSGDLRQEEFDEGAKVLKAKIELFQPEVACFVGLLGATAYVGRHVKPGPLAEQIGSTRLFAVPSPSRRNAHYGKEGILKTFQDLAEFVGR